MKFKIELSKEQKRVVNALASEVRNLQSEFETNDLTSDVLYGYIVRILDEAQVSSDIILKLLEELKLEEFERDCLACQG